MNANQPIKVIELRNYLVRPNARDRFIDYFENHFVESQNDLGGFVLGTFRIKNEADRFFWIRGFSDINSRSRYLPEFYGGEIWKKFGPDANEMMLECHNVHLLKPLEEISVEDFMRENAVTVIDFYFAKNNKLKELIELFQNKSASQNTTLWVSETSENDFPKLPVIQDESILVAITNYKNESEYQTNLNQSEKLNNQLQNLVTKKDNLILSSTKISLAVNSL
jgi:hypothetical protein